MFQKYKVTNSKNSNWLKQGSIYKTREGPNPFELVLSFSFMLTLWKITIFVGFGQPPVANVTERHIIKPRPFIWAYNQLSMTFRSKVLNRTSSSYENCCFGAFWRIFRWPNFTKKGRGHINTPRPFILAHNQYLPFISSGPYKKAIHRIQEIHRSCYWYQDGRYLNDTSWPFSSVGSLVIVAPAAW